MNTFFGKYRGTVANNLDPLSLGRVQVGVPAVYGSGSLSWAMPCVPFAGPGVGWFAIPPNGANVWVEFEEGDPNKAIWCGGFWNTGDPPASLPADVEKVLQTDGAELRINDTPGAASLLLKTTAGMQIEMSTEGITISNGMGAEIKLEGPKVTINGSAFEVM